MRLILLFLIVISSVRATEIGTPLSLNAKKVLFCGGGELAKEVVIELQRLGVEVIVIDRYAQTPAMQVAHRSHVIAMLNEIELRDVILKEKPDLIVPEIEAIATNVLVDLEQEGFRVIPTARATQLTMNREAIRRLASEELCLLTSTYRIAHDQEEYEQAIKEIGLPFVIKPIMSSSGKGQSIVRRNQDIHAAWEKAQSGGRTLSDQVIVESYIDFDYEITLLTLSHEGGISFCTPIGHKQVDGDYRLSWQPHPMSEAVLNKAQAMARTVVTTLGGYGIFGVEMFVKGEDVYFNEVSPRPHDTGMVTLISQNLSEFALHARAILGLPVPTIELFGPSASSALVVQGHSDHVNFKNIHNALRLPNSDLRLFGKPNVNGLRRMGVGLARGESIEEAKEKANFVTNTIEIEL